MTSTNTEQARARLPARLLAETAGFILRANRCGCALTPTDPGARQADINATLAFAHRQGATLFELRAALDDYELRGQPARAALIEPPAASPTKNSWPELARPQASPSEDSTRS